MKKGEMMENSDKDFLFANVMDKFEIVNKSNKIQNTIFFNSNEIAQLINLLKKYNNKRYFFFGGYEIAERKILIIYPKKFDEEFVRRGINEIIKAIKIKLPNELINKYTHSDYLSSIMKLGLERNRFGDIICFDDEAYIIVLNENAEYIKNNLRNLTKLKKANIEIIDINELRIKSVEFEDLKIIIASNRLDNFVSELGKCSRNGAEEYILAEKVLVNNIVELKKTKNIKEKDIITIRGKGKFIIDKYVGENKKGKEIYNIKKYK